MDSFQTIFLIITVVVVIASIVTFWQVSRVGPRGAVLLAGIGLYVGGIVLGIGEARLLIGLSGVLKLTGLVGFILGLIDLFRKRDYTTANRRNNIAAMQATLGTPSRPPKKTE